MTTPEGFSVFAQVGYSRLVGTLTLYCGDQDVAEELAHDALVRARERWDEVSEMAAPGAWLHRVAINLANSRFRRQVAERRALRRASVRRIGKVPHDPDSALLVRKAVSALPARQREAVILRYFRDLSVTEAAGLMDITPGSMKQLTHRALSSLRVDADIGWMLEQEAHDGT